MFERITAWDPSFNPQLMSGNAARKDGWIWLDCDDENGANFFAGRMQNPTMDVLEGRTFGRTHRRFMALAREGHVALCYGRHDVVMWRDIDAPASTCKIGKYVKERVREAKRCHNARSL